MGDNGEEYDDYDEDDYGDVECVAYEDDPKYDAVAEAAAEAFRRLEFDEVKKLGAGGTGFACQARSSVLAGSCK